MKITNQEEFKTLGDFLKGVASSSEDVYPIKSNSIPVGGALKIELWGTIKGNSSSQKDALYLAPDYGELGIGLIPLIEREFDTYEDFKVEVIFSRVYKESGGIADRYNVKATSFKTNGEISMGTTEGTPLGTIADCVLKLKHQIKSTTSSIFKIENILIEVL